MGRLHVDVGRHGWHVAGGLAAGAGGHSVDRFLIRPDGKRPRAWRLLLTHPHPRRLTRQHRSAREHGLIGVLAPSHAIGSSRVALSNTSSPSSLVNQRWNWSTTRPIECFTFVCSTAHVCLANRRGRRAVIQLKPCVATL